MPKKSTPRFNPALWLRPGLILAILLSSGCVHFYHSKTFTITVLDGDSGAPISGAKVHLQYWASELDLNGPKGGGVSGVTDAAGKVTIQATTFPHGWYATAESYLDGRGGEESSAVQLQLYRQPKPSLTLIIPDVFHGPVMLNTKAGDGLLQSTPGQRQFTFTVPLTGAAEFKAPDVFFVDGYNLKFVNADGHQIPQVLLSSRGGHDVPFNDTKGSVIYHQAAGGTFTEPRWAYDALPGRTAAREIESHGNHGQLWVIGTTDDAEVVATKLYLQKADEPYTYLFNEKAFDAMFTTAVPRKVDILRNSKK